MQCVWDIETNGLKPTKIWCLCAIKGDNMYTLENPTKEMVEDLFADVTVHIGHNLIGYDIPTVERLLNVSIKGEIIDTLVMSRLYNPQLEGGHSLAAWGERLNFPKGDYHDWSALTPEMVEYCKQDVSVTQRLHEKLSGLLSEFGDNSITLEHSVQRAITKQIQNGWLLDERKATDLVAELKEKQYDLEEAVHEKFRPLPTFIKEIVPKYKKDGSLSSVGLKFLGDNWTQVGGPFSRIDWPEFNLGSRQQIGRYLRLFGWKPEKFTETGQAIVDEKTLEAVTDIPEAQLIAEYLMVGKRIAQVQSWLDAVEDDGRVHGQVNAIGAVTGRMTHSSPNMAQVPAVGAPYGYECRACWIVPEGHKLVGVDASGLELRMLASFMNDKEYTNEILNGDIHTTNQRNAGLSTRSQAKTFIYAFLYGAGDAKIGSIVDGSQRTGARLRQRFLENTPALAELRERVSIASQRGYLRGLDGRCLHIRSEHSALNTLLQSAGAVVMKKALAIFTEYAPKWNLTYKLLGSIHDEYQIEAPEKHADKVGWLMVESIKAAGIALDLKCPLDGEYKVGNNWAETH
jgi:DNA polymerase I-like protein with 3'-5' exonuclease and polymerase domains